MVRYFKLYYILLCQNFQVQMEYKFDFIFGNITTVLGQVVGIAFVWVIFQSIGDLNGWTLPQIMIIYGIAALSIGLIDLFFNGIWRLNYYIRMGEFDRFMFRPIEPLFLILSDLSSLHGLGNFFSGVVIIVQASIALDLTWDVVMIIFLCMTVVCGTFIGLSVNVIVATVSFWYVGYGNSILFLMNRIRDFARYPIDIFAKPLQIFLMWVMPFAFTSFFPATFILRNEEFLSYAYFIPVVTVVICFFAYSFWQLGLNSYQSTGS
ncbi:MAG: hypothetical protein F4Y79_07800 [Gemmatimonadetes bacterium]|nr:hypothetical protein [Gemmatimonadota bacterium]